MEYRKKINCDTLFVGGICGYDKEGSPVWIDVFPLLDVKGNDKHLLLSVNIFLFFIRDCIQLQQDNVICR